MDDNGKKESTCIRILCRNLVISKNEPGLQWLIGSPLFPPFTVISTIRCIHFVSSDRLSPDFSKESDDLRTLLLKGFEVIGALIVGSASDFEGLASVAVDASRRLRNVLAGNDEENNLGKLCFVGAVVDLNSSDVRLFLWRPEHSSVYELVRSVVYEDQPAKYFWERGCLLKCDLRIKLPLYYPANNPKDVEHMFARTTEAVTARFRDSKAIYILESLNESLTEAPRPIVVRGSELNPQAGFSNEGSGENSLSCSYFCTKDIDLQPITSWENADQIHVNVLFSGSESMLKPATPVAEFFPAADEAKLLVAECNLEVLCFAVKDLLLVHAVSKLIIPGLINQLYGLRKRILPELLFQLPQLHPFHFVPPGFLHPVTAIYELNYGETEIKQVEVRRSLHLRLGLPLDRPLLRIANAIDMSKDGAGTNFVRKGTSLLKDVHLGIPSSGVSTGVVSLIQGSYEYYHYLQDGFDDSGWGCAYRSLQTLISWFKLQHYTSIDVPSHREIQQALVEIGDKDPSFLGSHEWIGAIELSFVLDKLLGVSCKVINVRSGDELPEKCRELAFHFESQGTPVMIGGGVLAYTLLGVDYNETSGDCAFLILDPHYTGTDDLKKIVNGGWCGWNKAVDSKGKHFFLHNKFYNLLLPQRPNMV